MDGSTPCLWPVRSSTASKPASVRFLMMVSRSQSFRTLYVTAPSRMILPFKLLLALLGQLVAEGFFLRVDVCAVAVGVDEWIRSALLEARIFFGHTIIVSVCAEENIALQRLEDTEGSFKIFCNLRVLLVIYDYVSL